MKPDMLIWKCIERLGEKTLKGEISWEMSQHTHSEAVSTTIGETVVKIEENGDIEITTESGEVFAWDGFKFSRSFYAIARNKAWSGKDKEEVAKDLLNSL